MTTKYNRAVAAYTGFKGTQTLAKVWAQVPQALRQQLTGAQLGAVMDAINVAYHGGRHSIGGVDICDDAVWVPAKIAGKNDWDDNDDNDTGKLIPFNVLRALKRAKNGAWTMPETNN